MDQEDGWDLPDLQFLGGVSVGFAVSAEHLVVVSQLLFLWEQPQTILLNKKQQTFRKEQQSYCAWNAVKLSVISITIRFLGRSFFFSESHESKIVRNQKLSPQFWWTSFWCLTWREHLLVEARGSDKYIKVSKVRDLRWQVRHCTVDLNWPWNSATMMDSFNSLCLFQATSAAVWSSRWSFSSSLYRFRLSAWEQRDRNVGNIVLKSLCSFGWL